MAAGAALRARAISAFRSAIKYWSSGAMVGYGAFASCACASHAALSTTTNAQLGNAVILTIIRVIGFILTSEFWSRTGISCAGGYLLLPVLLLFPGRRATQSHSIRRSLSEVHDCGLAFLFIVIVAEQAFHPTTCQ